MKRMFAALALLAGLSTSTLASAQSVTLDFPSWQAEEPGFSEWWKGLIQEYEAKHAGIKARLPNLLIEVISPWLDRRGGIGV